MARVPRSESTRNELKQMLDGRAGGDRSALVRQAARLIVEEALEAEVAQELGREYYAHGAGKRGYRNGYRTDRVKSAEGVIEFAVPQVSDTTEPFRSQIRQVIHNLVQNAQDALKNVRGSGRSPSIEVRTELDGDRVRLAVSDNGGGFPEELIARIFEPYVTTKPRGTGLGLAIVKKIIDEHHGSVAIENREPRGASVTVLLPLAKAA